MHGSTFQAGKTNSFNRLARIHPFLGSIFRLPLSVSSSVKAYDLTNYNAGASVEPRDNLVNTSTTTGFC